MVVKMKETIDPAQIALLGIDRIVRDTNGGQVLFIQVREIFFPGRFLDF